MTRQKIVPINAKDQYLFNHSFNQCSLSLAALDYALRSPNLKQIVDNEYPIFSNVSYQQKQNFDQPSHRKAGSKGVVGLLERTR